MAHIKVQLKFDGARLITIPEKVVVSPNDTVEWVCDDGDVEVSFAGLPVFEGEGRFRGRKGESTAYARVRADVPRGKHFDCNVTLDGKPVPTPYGVDTPGSD